MRSREVSPVIASMTIRRNCARSSKKRNAYTLKKLQEYFAAAAANLKI
jgi:hypothetical protein